jgi:L-rhamnose mutarotase
MSVGNSCAAYMRVYRKRKQLEEDNCNDVPKRTKLNAERQREYRETHKNLYVEYMCNYRQCKAQEIKIAQAGNSRAAYMREYRKWKQSEGDNYNNVPKRRKLNPERQHEYRETHKNLYVEYMRNYKKRKAQEIKMPQAGNSCAACMREYRKRKQKKIIVMMYPNEQS